MLGDTCPTCNCSPTSCSCSSSPQPLIPGADGAECADWVALNQVLWTGDPVPGTPIVTGSNGTEIVLWMIRELNLLDNRLTDLETP